LARTASAWDPAAIPVGGSDWHQAGAGALPGSPITWVLAEDIITGQVVPAGQGDGRVAETLAALRDSGFDHYLSLEPLLASWRR